MEALEAERLLLAEIEATRAEILELLQTSIQPLQHKKGFPESTDSTLEHQDLGSLPNQYGPEFHSHAKLQFHV